ncbi:hypothetical protein BHM03_00017710, partial [Ensete ventricosum]
NSLKVDLRDRHEIPRHQVQKVGALIASSLFTYLPFLCQVSKKQYHCDGCGICRLVLNQVPILCNDCGKKSSVRYHVLAHKCPGCSSYNTRQTRDGPSTCVTI